MEWDNETINGVLEQPRWNNKLICIQNKSVYYPQLIKMGIVTIVNMLTESGNFLGFNELKQKETLLTMGNYFLWLGIVHSLPCEWRRMIKAAISVHFHNLHCQGSLMKIMLSKFKL